MVETAEANPDKVRSTEPEPSTAVVAMSLCRRGNLLSFAGNYK